MQSIKISVTLLATLVLVATFLTGPAAAHIVKVADDSFVELDTLVEKLKGVDVVFVGERHGEPGHQEAQLQIIHALEEAGEDVAIGLEMFREDDQAVLDGWVEGNLAREELLEAYNRNWGMWPRYRPIFEYARQQRIPMVGLNLPRKVTAKVAREGFDSLSEGHLDQLPPVQCSPDPRYENFIRRAMGLHSDKGQAFSNFCEAQLLWDKVMAINLLEYLDDNPGKTVVVLAGSGHAWKYGIPEQISERSDYDYLVLMPQIDNRLTRETATTEEVDYLLMGVEQGPLH